MNLKAYFASASLAIAMLFSCLTLNAQSAQTPSKGFGWGLGIGSSIDMTGNSMTSVDIDGFLGYRCSAFPIIGVGAGVNMVMNNSTRCFPIFAIIRTSFSNEPKLCFLDLRCGVAYNDLYNYTKQTGLYARVGGGINLAKGKTWRSYILVSYSFIKRNDFEYDNRTYSCPDFQGASLGLGISF